MVTVIDLALLHRPYLACLPLGVGIRTATDIERFSYDSKQQQEAVENM